MYFRSGRGTLVCMPDHHLDCPYCGSSDLTPFPDPTSAWTCLDCTRVLRVELVQPASVTGWGVLRVVVLTHAAA